MKNIINKKVFLFLSIFFWASCMFAQEKFEKLEGYYYSDDEICKASLVITNNGEYRLYVGDSKYEGKVEILSANDLKFDKEQGYYKDDKIIIHSSMCSNGIKTLELLKIPDGPFITIDGSLVDGIDLNSSNSLFHEEELSLNKDVYNGVHLLWLKDISIQEILHIQDIFFSSLLYDDGQANTEVIGTLIKLLAIRIQQNQDGDSFLLLQELFKYFRYTSAEATIEYNTKVFVGLFLDNPYFFIQQSFITKDVALLTYIMEYLNNDYFSNEASLFMESDAVSQFKKGQLFMDISKISNFKRFKQLTSKLNRLPKIKINYLENKYAKYQYPYAPYPSSLVDVSSIFAKELTSKLSTDEKKIYDDIIFPVLKENSIRNYHVNDPDGYVNLREEPNSSSKILKQIPNGTYVCLLNIEKGNWIYAIYEREFTQAGYIHKSRLEEK